MPETFQLVAAPNGVQYLACSAIAVPHGFSTRLGGASAAPFDSLNLGIACGDDAETVRANRARWAEALGVAAPIVSLHQVHGPDVHAVSDRPRETLYGDAVVSATPGLPVSVFTADCTPVLLHDPVTGAVGAVHAGWRGTVAGVVGAAVAAMRDHHGARPADLVAAIGPAIGPCCFEVGPEVVEAAAAAAWPGWERAAIARSPRPHFDLFAANTDQLLAAGLARPNIHVSGLCTVCRDDWFFSWRRDAARTGRLQAAIASRGGAR